MLRRCILTMLLGMLFLPIVQNMFHVFEVLPLRGDFAEAPDIEFRPRYWFNGIYQEEKERYMNEQFGLRNTFVRFNNQVNFELYKKTSNVETVIGKDNNLFAGAYIESYTGQNFVGDSVLEKKAADIRQIQDLMRKQGKLFIPVLAPNKARIQHDLLPENTKIIGPSNYEVITKKFREAGVSFIDFNDYFLKNLRTSKYPLFSKYGVHWSSYGHALAADSIVKYVSHALDVKTPMPDWQNTYYLTDTPKELDYDAGNGMNLLRTLPSEPLAYARYRFRDKDQYRPPVMVVADSYNFGLELTGIYDTVFSKYLFLYYFKEARPVTENRDAFITMNLKQEINQHQVFLLVATEHNLMKYGWGFIEKTLNVMKGIDEPLFDETEKQILLTMSTIRNDKKWYAEVAANALSKRRPLEAELRTTALYVVNNKKNKDKSPLDKMKFTIQSDPKWMTDVRERARVKKISVDSALVLDALYQLEIHQ